MMSAFTKLYRKRHIIVEIFCRNALELLRYVSATTGGHEPLFRWRRCETRSVPRRPQSWRSAVASAARCTNPRPGLRYQAPTGGEGGCLLGRRYRRGEAVSLRSAEEWPPSARGRRAGLAPHRSRGKMVLPVRIELTTSALPRMRSTTELRQHSPGQPGREGPMCRPAPDCQPASPQFIVPTMNDSEKKARLADALRDNLRRRKAQARAARDTPDADDQRDRTQSPAK
jgi:hypothetical protein